MTRNIGDGMDNDNEASAAGYFARFRTNPDRAARIRRARETARRITSAIECDESLAHLDLSAQEIAEARAFLACDTQRVVGLNAGLSKPSRRGPAGNH
jgi:hypothetical protein